MVHPVGNAFPDGRLVSVFVITGLGASTTLAREPITEVEAVLGDAADGLATLPVAIGPRKPTIVGDAYLVITMLLPSLTFLTGTLRPS